MVLIVGSRLIDLYVNGLWFGALGYSDVYRTVLFTRLVQFVVGGVLIGGGLALNLAIAYRVRPLFAAVNGPEDPSPASVPVQTTATGGVGGRVGDIVVRDAAFTFDGPIEGDTVYQPGDDAVLQLTIVNEGDRADRLVRVTSPIARSATITGDARIARRQVLTAGYQAPFASTTLPDTDAVRIVLIGLRSPVSIGFSYPVVFTFERAGELHLELPVENPSLS